MMFQGVMLSHDNITIAADVNTSLHAWEQGQERVVSYLPLSHIAGLMHDIFFTINKAGTACSADSNALNAQTDKVLWRAEGLGEDGGED